jgi:UDP-N-acetylmuramoyl-tripeptide--D-alanyl-D-alanine ligase
LGDKKWKIESGLAGMSFKISYEGTIIPFRLPYALGRGQVYAALAASAIGIHFGYNLVEISEILSNYRPLPGRMNLIKGINNSLIIDDTFNSNPCSAASALETLKKLDATRKMVVLGDMLELGEYCESGHREIGRLVPESSDLLFAYGNRSKIISKQAEKGGMKKDKIFHFDNVGDLIKLLKSKIKSNDVILIKGSRAMHMERIVEEIMAK